MVMVNVSLRSKSPMYYGVASLGEGGEQDRSHALNIWPRIRVSAIFETDDREGQRGVIRFVKIATCWAVSEGMTVNDTHGPEENS